MVQRKVPNKLGLQADHLLKSEKRLSNLKPTSFQHPDGKNRGSDMKKKMKRSKSIKIPDFESFNSPPAMPGPVKPPPLCSPATPQVKSGGGSPNYMKGTTSSEARKERLRKSSDLYRKPMRGLTKSSSLKMVRTLTKSPSFKKRSSRAGLCADVDVQKATCSSTLKDSKFPAYLMLNPGGTESQGTSVEKVCPYSYCSLNGHHHAPSPPLKSFLKAKRRSMKTQKSFKLQKPSSPRRVKPTDNGTEENSTDFFVEIYVKKIADDQVSENMSDVSPQSEIDLEENCVNGSLSFLADESRTGSCNSESEIEGENVSDMEWEEAKFSDSEICEEEYKCCISVECQSDGIKQLDDGTEIVGSDDGDSSCTEEILADDVLQELFCEESASFGFQCHESDSEIEDVEQNWEVLEEKSEESERDSADSAVESNEFEMNPSIENADETEDYQSSGLEELPSGTAEDPIEKQEQFPTQELDDIIDSAETDHQLEDQHSEGSIEHKDSRIFGTGSDGTDIGAENTKVEVQNKSDAEQNSHMEDNGSSARSGSKYQRGSKSGSEADDSSSRKWTINCRKPGSDLKEEEREFNPREPSFLPVVPDPEAEKVDLKHQDMDDRKNAEEWMLDYALQQTVTKLAPARKRKVALLVEAFEKVLPIPKYDTRHIRNDASAFSPRPIQACS